MKCPKCEYPPTIKHAHGECLSPDWASWDLTPPEGWEVDMKRTYLLPNGKLCVRLKKVEPELVEPAVPMRTEKEIRERLGSMRPHKSSPHFLRGIGKVKQPKNRYDNLSGTKSVYISALEWVLSEPICCPHCGVAIEGKPETVENPDEGP